jgi:predicted ATPase
MSSFTAAFEGRCAELEFLLARLSGALSGGGGLVVIAGEAGIGKTRLVDEFKKIGSQVDCEILTGKCISGPPSPYLPFRDMLPRRWVMDEFHEEAGNAKDGDRFPYRILDLVKELSEEKTLIIVLEDMQWADEYSTTLLHFLSRRIHELNVIIVCTYRPKEILNIGAERRHPLYETLKEMRKEDLCDEIVLGPLGKPELGMIADSILDHPLERASLEHLMSCTGSNTLYFIETLLSMVAEGVIVLDEGIWMMTQGTRVPLNDSVRQAVLAQMDLLTGLERRILELASVMGIRFDYTVVADMLEQDRSTVSELLDAIETRTELIKDVGEGYCFSDDLTREVIRAQISPMRQKEFLKAADRLLLKSG